MLYTGPEQISYMSDVIWCCTSFWGDIAKLKAGKKEQK
jgi:hypothetical protein